MLGISNQQPSAFRQSNNPTTLEIAGAMKDIMRNVHALFKHRPNDLEIELKPDGTEITTLDRLVNRDLAESLRGLLPAAIYVSEESILSHRGHEDQIFASEFLWIVDEIDGTQNYVRQIPLYCVSIGLFRKTGEVIVPVLGAILEPASGDLTIGAEMKVTTENLDTGNSQKVTAIRPGDTVSPLFFVSDDVLRSGKLPNGASYRCTGSAALDILFTGLGRGEATILHYNIWDMAGALAVVSALQLATYDLSTGSRREGLKESDFEPITLSGNWTLKKPLLVCREDNLNLALKYLGSMKSSQDPLP